MKNIFFPILVIALCMFFSSCGNGFSVGTKVATDYLGSPGEYCNLPSNFSNLRSQENIVTSDQLSELRSEAETLTSQNRLQEAIWLYLDDPQGDPNVITLKQQLNDILNSDSYQIQDGSSLGGTFEKYILTF